jgi:hypothetical protein
MKKNPELSEFAASSMIVSLSRRTVSAGFVRGQAPPEGAAGVAPGDEKLRHMLNIRRTGVAEILPEEAEAVQLALGQHGEPVEDPPVHRRFREVRLQPCQHIGQPPGREAKPHPPAPVPVRIR